LQFCNTVINYYLPWNPQKIEQRIGRCHRYGQKNDVVVINLLNTQNVADKRVYEILSEKFELFQGVFGASDKAIGLLESGADFEKRVSQIYQECRSAAEFTKEFSALEKELERKRNRKIDELRGLLTQKTPDAHKQSFERILDDIEKYQSQKRYWGKINTSGEYGRFPKYYVMQEKFNISQIEHGYILIGGYYLEDSIENSVFYIVDEQGKMFTVEDEMVRELVTQIEDAKIKEQNTNDASVIAYIENLELFLWQNYHESKREIIRNNNLKVDNWLELRKEEYVLKVKDTSDTDELMRQYEVEADFRRKIALKKQLEELKSKQEEMIKGFHEEVSMLEAEASRMKEEFESEIVRKPLLYVKMVIKF